MTDFTRNGLQTMSELQAVEYTLTPRQFHLLCEIANEQHSAYLVQERLESQPNVGMLTRQQFYRATDTLHRRGLLQKIQPYPSTNKRVLVITDAGRAAMSKYIRVV